MSWHRRRFDKLNEENCFCSNPMCKAYGDEWAHLEPTKLSGMGRGRNARLFDILRHRSSYARLCKYCHAMLDERRYRL